MATVSVFRDWLMLIHGYVGLQRDRCPHKKISLYLRNEQDVHGVDKFAGWVTLMHM